MKLLLKPDCTFTKVQDPNPDVDLTELTICLDSVGITSPPEDLYPCKIILYDTYKLRLAQVGPQTPQTPVAVSEITLKQNKTASVCCEGVKYDGPIVQVAQMMLDGETSEDFNYEKFLRHYISCIPYSVASSLPSSKVSSSKKRTTNAGTTKQPKKAKVSTTKLNVDAYEQMAMRCKERMGCDEEIIQLHHLKHDSTVRPRNTQFVNDLKNVMLEGHWLKLATVFFVVEDPADKGTYLVMDGNHRLAAMIAYNDELTAKGQVQGRMTSVNCYVFKAKNARERIEAAFKPMNMLTQLPVAAYRMAKLVRLYVVSVHGRLPSNRVEVRAFRLFASGVFQDKITIPIVSVASLDADTWDKLTELDSAETSNKLDLLTSKFFDTFLKACNRDLPKAIAVMQTLKTESTEIVFKKLREIPSNLLNKLAGKVPHEWQSNEQAISYLTGGRSMTAAAFDKVLIKMRFASSRATTQDKLRAKCTEFLKETTKGIPSMRYVEAVEDGLTTRPNVFILYEPSTTTLSLIDSVVKHSVVIVLSQSSEMPTISSNKPTMTFSIMMPMCCIDSGTTFPSNLVFAGLYHPKIPDDPYKERCLVEMAIEKQLIIGRCIPLANVDALIKFADTKQTAMVLGLSKQVADAFLPELLKFKTVIFGLNTELNELIDGQYARDLLNQLLKNDRNQNSDEINGNEELVNEDTMDFSNVSTASSSSVVSTQDQ